MADCTMNQDSGIEYAPQILIVDDDANILKMMEMICARAGMGCQLALTGAEALKLVNAVPDVFDVVLMDTMMPGMHGCEATARMRQIPGSEYLVIVICTVSASADELTRAIESGADDVLYKPFMPRELIERLDTWTQTSRMRRLWLTIPDQDRFDHFYTRAAADQDIRARVMAAEWLVTIAQTREERQQIRDLLQTWLNDLDEGMVQAAKRLLRQLE